MWRFIFNFIFGLLYENGNPSLTRVLLSAGFFIFCVGTGIDIWFAFIGKTWADYPTFATITGGGSIGGQLANKITNSLANSPKQEMPDKGALPNINMTAPKIAAAGVAVLCIMGGVYLCI